MGIGTKDRRVFEQLSAAGLQVEFVASPNFNERPPPGLIDTLIIHYTCLPLKESIQLLSCTEKEVSTHYIIARDGALFQLVSVEKRAWHAGVSELYGRMDTNSFGIGIDLVFEPKFDTEYTEAQYSVLGALGRALVREFPIEHRRIVGHEHVALPPGRKQDPGPLFDWKRFYDDLDVADMPAILHTTR